MDKLTTTPKQPQAEVLRDWYPYYAGFTEKFVKGLLDAHLNEAQSIIDLWNGSGTTTAVCERSGIEFVGLDINPALTVIARARLTPLSIAQSLSSLGERLILSARREEIDYNVGDPLGSWMRPDAVRRIRSLEFSIRRHFDGIVAPPTPPRVLSRFIDSLSLLSCFYYAALFSATRDILRRFKSSNPTWQTLPRSPFQRVAPHWETVGHYFLDRVTYLSRRLSTGAISSSDPPDILRLYHESSAKSAFSDRIRTGTATSLPYADCHFDGCITSPPYATRIDYIKSTLPELAVLGASVEEITELRRCTTGSPIVKNSKEIEAPIISPTAARVLRHIREHASKGSRTYYYPWMHRYFKELQVGLAEVERVVKQSGKICVVIQDSYYKDQLIDLQQIVVETFRSHGRQLVHRDDHVVRHNMAQLNPHARSNVKHRHNTESLLVLQ